jgi:hypothetical protein
VSEHELLERTKAIETTLRELIELGGPELAERWPGVVRMHRVAASAVGEPELLDDEEGRTELVDKLQAPLSALYGGYGSFVDWPLEGPAADRFERLKDELRTLVTRL